MSERFTTLKTIQQAYKTAKPAEREQITACVSNARRNGFNFFLTRLRNLDTGKPLLTVGYGLHDTEGITTELIRKVVGLPPLEEETNGKSTNNQRRVGSSGTTPHKSADSGGAKRLTGGQGKQVIHRHNQDTVQGGEKGTRHPLKGGKRKSK